MMFVWEMNPVLVHVGSLQVRWYGLFFAVSFLLGYEVIKRIFRRENQSEADLERLLGFMIAGTIIGARLGHVLFYEPDVYLRDPIRILKIWEGGLASHGGAIGILFALWLGARKTSVPAYLWLLDRVAIPTALGAFFIRVGNFVNSEIVGRPTSLPWAVVFKRVDAIPRHPAQLYEALSYITVFVLLLSLYERPRVRAARGFLIGLFLVLVFSSRIAIEFIKENQVGFEKSLPLDMGQILSFPVVAVGIVLIFKSGFWKRDYRLGDQDLRS